MGLNDIRKKMKLNAVKIRKELHVVKKRGWGDSMQ